MIAITGMGVLTSIGLGIREFAAALKQGKAGIRPFQTENPALSDVKLAALLPASYSFKERVCDLLQSDPSSDLSALIEETAHRAPFSVEASVLATLEAWTAANLSRSPATPERIGIIVAGQGLSSNYLYQLSSKFHESPEYLSPRYAYRFMDTDHVGTLSKVFGIRGEGFTLGAASASGNIALIQGAQMISSRRADVCLVIAPVADLSPIELQAFRKIGALGGQRYADAPEKAYRPFDRDRDGFIYGQGAACIVLESESSAAKRGVTQLAWVAGASQNLDGNHLTDPSVDGEAKAMSEAMKNAGVNGQQISYINAHGSGSILGDAVEVEAIEKVFGSQAQQLWVNSSKGLIGHCIYSAGLVEAVATVLQLREGFVHPNVNLENPISDRIRFVGGKSERAQLNYAMNLSYGFSGVNSCVVLKT